MAARMLCAGLLLALLVKPAWAADTASSTVQPLGVFSAVRATEDHTYGQRARLWHRGTQLLGEILYWDGNIEGQRGRFADGFINRRSGEVRFKIAIVRRDVQPSTRADATFEGILNKGVLAGKLTWISDAAKFRGKAGVEDWTLRFEKDERLDAYSGVEAWRKSQAE